MGNLKKIIFVFICIFPFVGISQIAFYKKFTSGPFDQGNGLTQLPDSSYAVTGASGGFDNNSGQAYLMLTDSLGNQKWTKHYGGFGEDIGVRVIHVPGDGFFIAGHSGSTANGDFDFVVYKTDETGDLQWEKMYGSSDWEILHDAALLDDGGLILVGETEGQLSQGKDVYMVRTTAIGDTVWTKTIQTPQDDFASAVEVVSNTEFMIGGNLGNAGTSLGMLTSFDIDGTKNWTKFLDYLGTTSVYDIVVHQNNIYAAGDLLNTSENKKDFWIMKTDLLGEHVAHELNNIYSKGGKYSCLAVNSLDSVYASMVSVSPEINPYPGGLDVNVHKLTENLSFLTSYAFSGYDEDVVNQLIVTNDDGVALVGTVSDDQENSSLGTDVLLAKIGPDNENENVADLGNDLVNLMTEKKETITVHPNPTNSIINIPQELEDYPFELRNIQGQVVKSGSVRPQLNLSLLDDGIYFLSIVTKKQMWSAKIIKK